MVQNLLLKLLNGLFPPERPTESELIEYGKELGRKEQFEQTWCATCYYKQRHQRQEAATQPKPLAVQKDDPLKAPKYVEMIHTQVMPEIPKQLRNAIDQMHGEE